MLPRLNAAATARGVLGATLTASLQRSFGNQAVQRLIQGQQVTASTRAAPALGNRAVLQRQVPVEEESGYAPIPGAEAPSGYAPVPGAEASSGYAPVPGAEASSGYAPVPGAEASSGYAPVPGAEASSGYAPVPEEGASSGYAPVPGASSAPAAAKPAPAAEPARAAAQPGSAPVAQAGAPSAPAAGAPGPAAGAPGPAAGAPGTAAPAGPAAAPAAGPASDEEEAPILSALRPKYAGEKDKPAAEKGAAWDELSRAVHAEAGELKRRHRRMQQSRARPDRPEVVRGHAYLYDQLWQKLSRQELPVSPEGDVDEAALRARAVTYDEGADAQARTKVTVGGGRLVRNDPPHNTGQPVDTAESVTFFSGLGREIFVVSPDGAIHMSSHKIGQYHHSSLLAAGGVVMAGEMAVTGGTITAMSNKSGHYEPTARQFRQFLRRLKREGVALTFPITGWGVKDGPAEAFASGSGK